MIDTLRTHSTQAPAGLAPKQPAPRRLRVALIGCGAIAKALHLPVLAGHDDISLAALVDRDVGRATELAKGYGVGTVLADAADIPAGAIDAAIVASPPFHHAPCTIALLNRGIHVLVEKPMATNGADAAEMVRVAEEKGLVLAVGFFRRLYPSIRLLKAMLDAGQVGRVRRFVAKGGDMYNWGAATLGNMKREQAGGGVLIDFGSHLIDLLFTLFDGPADILEYRDNALGGVESDCSLRLLFQSGGAPVEGVVELGRTRRLGYLIRVEGERGALEFQVNERHCVRVLPGDANLNDPMTGRQRPYRLDASWVGEQAEESWYETFRTQIDDWVDAIRAKRPPLLSGRSALPTVELVQECYRQVQPLDEPWVREGLDAPVWQAARGDRPRRVLLTGATGFIGARLAEIATLGCGWQVRALVHNPANASRLARLPVEMVQGELSSPAEAQRLVDGCDAVIHGAIGTTWGDRKEIFAVNVGGTRTLAEAALAAGVQRFVHLSTIALHGPDVAGIMDEATPVRPPTGDDYSESKVEAERALAVLTQKGLPAVILRPACVYGPFSRIFIVRPVEAMAQGRFRLLDRADGPSNMVYVDNVIAAIVRSVTAPAEAVTGEVFTITDDDQLSWREFYTYFANALGFALPDVAAPNPAGGRRSGNSWLSPAAWVRGVGAVVGSQEFRSLGSRVLRTDPLGTLPRKALDRFPGLDRRLREWLKVDGLPVYRRPAAGTVDDPVEMGVSKFLVSSAKARRLLGYTSVVNRPRAMELTLDWVRHAGLVL